MAVAQVSGSADRLSVGRDKDWPRERALAELHSITRDPAVFGTVLGNVLYKIEAEPTGWGAETAELLRAAGADEAVAAARVEWQRERARGRDGGFRL
jgi:hypothetical protein